MKLRVASLLAGVAAALVLSLGSSAGAWAAEPAAFANYALHPGDKLDISVWKELDMQKSIIISPDGKFSFPLAGQLTAVGKTVDQIRGEIEAKLKPFIPEPVVTVTITDVGGNIVYVIGQVSKAGAFVMNRQMTVLQALSMAGGTTPYAALNDIIVIRTAGGRQQPMQFRYNEVSKGKSLDQNVLLESGDVVVVP